MPRERKVWPHENGLRLGNELVKGFFEFRLWEKKTTPGFELEKDYNKFLQKFAEEIGASGQKAIRNQIDLATRQIDETCGVCRAVFKARAWAYETGFVNPDYHTHLLEKVEGNQWWITEKATGHTTWVHGKD